MIGGLFEYPPKAAFGKVVPKTRIHIHGRPSRRIRDRLTAEVAQIVWKHKLAPETINLPARPEVCEIQVFVVELKPGFDELSEDVLRCIDKATPTPIVFEIARGDLLRVAAAYKRPSEADSSKWVISEYFTTDWIPADSTRSPLPVALDLASLYHLILRELVDIPVYEGESMQALVDRTGRIRQLRRQCSRLEGMLLSEKQFNRKIEINAQLRVLREQLSQMMA